MADELDRLKAEQHELDEFISLIAHALNTPLTAVRGYAQLLYRQRARSAADDTVASIPATIVEQSDRLAALTTLLLDVSRVRRDRIALRRKDADLGAVVRASVAAQRDAVAHLEAPDSGPVFSFDAERIGRIVGALVRYLAGLGAGGPLRVVVESRDREAIVSAERDADPLSEAAAGRLFHALVPTTRVEPNKQLTPAELYVARGVAEAHGGALTVESPIAGTSRGIRLVLTLRTVGDER